MVYTHSSITIIGCLVVVSITSSWNASVAVAQVPAADLRNMFEKLGQQSESFVPGMFSELTPAEMAELEKVAVSKKEEADFGSQVLNNYESSLRSQNKSLRRDGKDVKYLAQLVNVIQPNMANAKRYSKIDIGIVNSDTIDAYSIPGGHLLFTIPKAA